MKKIVLVATLLMICTLSKAQKDSTTQTMNKIQPSAKPKGGLGFYPLSKSISYKSSMANRIYFDAKIYFEISNVMLYKFRPAVNYRMIHTETVKLYSGIGMNFEAYTKSLTIPFGMEFFPFERIKTLSINLESGLNFLLLPGYTHVDLGGDIGLTYYFTRNKKVKTDN